MLDKRAYRPEWWYKLTVFLIWSLKKSEKNYSENCIGQSIFWHDLRMDKCKYVLKQSSIYTGSVLKYYGWEHIFYVQSAKIGPVYSFISFSEWNPIPHKGLSITTNQIVCFLFIGPLPLHDSWAVLILKDRFKLRMNNISCFNIESESKKKINLSQSVNLGVFNISKYYRVLIQVTSSSFFFRFPYFLLDVYWRDFLFFTLFLSDPYHYSEFFSLSQMFSHCLYFSHIVYLIKADFYASKKLINYSLQIKLQHDIVKTSVRKFTAVRG